MAETLILSVKSNIKSVTKDTEDYGKSVVGVEKKLENVNSTLKEQKDILKFLQQEEVRLKQKRMGQSEYEQSLSKINKTLERTKLSIQDQKLAVKDLTDQQREAKDAVKEMAVAQKEQGDTLLSNIGNYKVFGISLNGIKKSFGQIIPTAKLMFKTIKAGLISTGIGALVVAFGALMAWFKKTKVGAEALAKIFAGLGAAVSVIVDRISKFGGAIAKLFSGDVKGAFSDMKGALSGMGEEMLREVTLAVALKQSLQDLADRERALSVEVAQRRAEIEELKLKSDDLNLSEAERLEALNEAADIERNLMTERVANAEEAVRIQQAQMSMSENLKEDLDALAAKEIALANIRRESSAMQRTLTRKMNRIKRQAEAKDAAAHKKWKARIDEERSYQNEVIQSVNDQIKQMQLDAIQDEELKAIKIIMIARQAEIDKIELIKDSSKTEEELEVQKAELTMNIMSVYGQKILDIKADFKKKGEELDLEEQQKLKDIQNENLLLTIENARDKADKELEIAEETELKENSMRTASAEDKGRITAEIEEKYRLLRKEKKEQEAIEDKERDAEVLAAKVEILAQGLAVIQGFMDVQSQQIENDYNNEIKLAKAQGKSIEGIEEKFAEKRREQAKKMKAMKIAMAIVDTYQSAVSAYAAGVSIGGPAGLILGPVSAALAIAAGIANVAMIEKQPLGDGGGGGGGGTGGAPTPESPAPQMTQGAFQLEGGVAPEPVKAFVVTDDMTNSQNQLANIRRRATI